MGGENPKRGVGEYLPLFYSKILELEVCNCPIFNILFAFPAFILSYSFETEPHIV